LVGETELLHLTFDPSGAPAEVKMKQRLPVTPTFGVLMNVSYGVLDQWHEWLTEYIGQFRSLYFSR
jgi:hypothetical protein